MTATVKRQMIHIDEAKCNGCGLCIVACAEGALKIIDGKARLVSEKYCDGLGACLGECPQGALTIEEKEVAAFDEAAARAHQAAAAKPVAACPSAGVREWAGAASPASGATIPSALRQWPVQLTLVPPGAPFLQGADLLLVADCVPFAAADLHQRYLPGHALLVACPKLDDYAAHQAKLTAIVSEARPKSLTVLHMEVPCCSGLVRMARQAISASGLNIPLKDVTINIQGNAIA